MTTQTLEQKRALYALDVIQRHSTRGDDKYKRRYGTLVRSLPSMILQNGLGQALAYLLADAGKSEEEKPALALYRELQEWLRGPKDGETRPERVYPDGDLIQALMQGSRFDYRRAQEASLALFAWTRKFADAYLPKE